MDPTRPRIAPTLGPAAPPSSDAAGAHTPEAVATPPTPAQRLADGLRRSARKLQPALQRAWRWLAPRLRPTRLAAAGTLLLRGTGRVLLWLLVTAALLSLLPPAAVLWLRDNPPPTSAFMLDSDVQPVDYRWVPAARLPDSLRRAVVAAEDQKFWDHWGFDFAAIAEALEHNKKGRTTRGASTITQQTAKNLFLWQSRSWVRKGLEASFTLLLEGLWSKQRILEVYLNIAEFGPGIYGAEAAAQRYFRKPAEKLTREESALLAAVLPSPRKWHADRPGPYVQARAAHILELAYGPPAEEAVEEADPLAVEDWAEADDDAPPGGAAAPEGAPGAGDGSEAGPAPETVPAGTGPEAPVPEPGEGAEDAVDSRLRGNDE